MKILQAILNLKLKPEEDESSDNLKLKPEEDDLSNSSKFKPEGDDPSKSLKLRTEGHPSSNTDLDSQLELVAELEIMFL